MKKTEILSYLDSRKDYFSRWSDAIWDFAEVRFEEQQSADYYCERLSEEGFAIERGVAELPTAFVARWGSGKPVIGFLGEYDALPDMNQCAGVAERQSDKPGKGGHGCGHNLLGVGAAAAAIGLKQYLESEGLGGTVVFFGCPAEEGGSGKTFMARAHLFDDVDCALTWHPGSGNSVAGGSCLANYLVRYEFKGVASHAAASPQMGRSALDAAELMNIGVQFLREHMDSDARVHYAFTDAGGASPNVVQSHAAVNYQIRAPKMPQVEKLYERVNLIAKGAAMMTETEVDIHILKGCSNTVPNVVMERIMYENLLAIPPHELSEEDKPFVEALSKTLQGGGMMRYMISSMPDSAWAPGQKEKALAHVSDAYHSFTTPYVPSDKAMPASSDVGDVSWVTPTAQCGAATWAAGTAAHSWQAVASGKTDMAHGGMLFAAKVMAATAIDLYDRPEALLAAREELNRRLEGAPYHNPMPDDIHPADLMNG